MAVVKPPKERWTTVESNHHQPRASSTRGHSAIKLAAQLPPSSSQMDGGFVNDINYSIKTAFATIRFTFGLLLPVFRRSSQSRLGLTPNVVLCNGVVKVEHIVVALAVTVAKP